MKKHNPHLIDIKTISDAKVEIKKIGSDPASIDIMAPKMISKVIKLNNIILQDAIIIKQDMLSIGGEVAVPKETFKLHNETGDILIIGSLKQLKELTFKIKRHYNRLKKVSEELEFLIKEIK